MRFWFGEGVFGVGLRLQERVLLEVLRALAIFYLGRASFGKVLSPDRLSDFKPLARKFFNFLGRERFLMNQNNSWAALHRRVFEELILQMHSRGGQDA